MRELPLKHILALSIAIFGTCLIHAQHSKILKGTIKTSDSLSGALINIINITQNTGTLSGENGDFQIEVKENDSLYFSSVQYEIEKIRVSQKIFKSGFLQVLLKENINQLEEVRISNIGLSGNLSADLSQMKTIEFKKFGIKYIKRKEFSKIDSDLSVAHENPVNFLISYLNGDLKMLRKAKENEELKGFVLKAKNVFPDEVYTESLQLAQAEIINFVYYCANFPALKPLVNGQDKLALLNFYKKQVEAFKKLRAPSKDEKQIGNSK